MANANVFAESPEVIHPDRVKKLRNKILKDVARKVPDEELLKFRYCQGNRYIKNMSEYSKLQV